MNSIDKIYVVHYAPLKDRLDFMIRQFNMFNIKNYEFVLGPSRYDLDPAVIDKFNKENNTHLTTPIVAISITHVEIYRDIVKNNYKSCLILEDDAILCADFDKHFDEYMKAIPDDYDMAFINSGCNLHAEATDDTIWYKMGKTRTCCAYVVTKKACEAIIPSITPFKNGIDQDLNTVIENQKLNVYWCEPTIVFDGSEDYGSSHDTNRLGKHLDMFYRNEL